jgi:tetratricopeptide (TPR) repeat protein
VGQIAEYRLDLEVPEGTSQIAVGIRDDLNTELSILSIDLPTGSRDRVSAGSAAGSDGTVRASDVATLRLPTAALVVSGQNGGVIGLTLEAILEPASDDLWRVPVEIQMKLPSGEDLQALDLFVYALAGDGATVVKDARVVPGDQVKTVVPLELATGRYAIRVAVRDRGSSAFGVMGMEIEIPSSESGQVRWSSTAHGDDLPSEDRLPGSKEIGKGDMELSRANVLSGYDRVLAVLSKGDEVAAREALRDMEIGLAGDRSPRELADLAKMEGRVLKGMANGDWNRLLPLAVLYGEMIDDYRRLRQAPLSEHAVVLSIGMAEQMVRTAKGAEDRREAADLLTSMSGYLLYAQRLTKTGELLSLAVKADPQNLSALMALAATREQKGDYEGALKVLEDLLEAFPDSGEGRLRFGVNLARVGKSWKAVESFRQLVEADTEEWVAQVASQELARALVDVGETAEAVDILEFAAARWPEQPSMRVQLAWLLDQIEEPEQAEAWVSGLISDSSRATNPPRYRYIQWYEKGLEELRRSLGELSVRRAGEWSRTPGSPPQEAESR